MRLSYWSSQTRSSVLFNSVHVLCFVISYDPVSQLGSTYIRSIAHDQSICFFLCGLLLPMSQSWSGLFLLSNPVDIFWTMLIVWTLRGKILRTALCSVAYNSLNSDICRNEQCLKFVGWLGSDFVFVHLLWFNITCVFCVSLGPFCFCIACFLLRWLLIFCTIKPRHWLRRTSANWPFLC